MNQTYRVGVDIGGTFTDLIIVNEKTGDFHIEKVLTTPDDPSQAVETAISQVVARADIPVSEMSQMIHGTTLVTNAMIERKGSATALLTTAGFRDSIEIGRETRFDLYDLNLEKPRPLVPRHLRFDVPQRTRYDGKTIKPLDVGFVEQLARELVNKGIEAVAVCFLHSFTNPDDEQQARDAILRVAPDLRVSISSEVSPEIREYERASTTIGNVYVQKLVETYLHRLKSRLEQLAYPGGFYLMHSSGGIATIDTTIQFPIRLLESGPAAGALAAKSIGTSAGDNDLISFDMGGTTAKICVIENGQPLLAHEFEVDRTYRFKKGSGLPIKLPVIELIEIGTGGGSIARVDSMGLLKVGPDSSGAKPGPVCYGRGGQLPTVTDANLVLGYLNAEYFLGGEMKLDLEAARSSIADYVATPLNISIEEAAWGIHQIANENMANAARVHTLERGKDPRQFPMYAFGGAGPVHAYRIALSLGSPKLVAPRGAGVMSSYGFLTAPLSFDFVRSWPVVLEEIDWDRANQILAEMERQGHELLVGSGVAADKITHHREAEMRYVGQGHQISVSLPVQKLSADHVATIQKRFVERYQSLYEREGPPVDLEVINWRVVSSGPHPDIVLNESTLPPPEKTDVIKDRRQAWFPESSGFVDCPVYDRYQLSAGDQFEGPAIVEERESTTIIGPNANCRIDQQQNLVVTMPTVDEGAD